MLKLQIPVLCRGRDIRKKEILKKPVAVTVRVNNRTPSNLITIDVDCPHSCGSHGGGCKASGVEARCPYSIDLPYGLD
jgi:hypothetical protein